MEGRDEQRIGLRNSGIGKRSKESHLDSISRLRAPARNMVHVLEYINFQFKLPRSGPRTLPFIILYHFPKCIHPIVRHLD